MVAKFQQADEPGLLLVDADRREPTLTAAVAVRTARGQAVSAGPERGYLWHEQDRPNDLVAQRWGVLGDPAARLAVAAKPAAASKPASLQAHVSDFFGGMNVTPAAATEPGIDRIEQAIGQVLAGSQTPQRAAQGLGISAAELAQLVETYRRAGRGAIGRG